MEYKLVADSCCELVPALTGPLNARTAPLTILLDDVSYVDDDSMDIPRFLAAMKQSRHIPKSVCPAPDVWARLFLEAKEVFAVTLSSKLSGSYNSAMVAREMVESEHPGHRVHVFDSLSASAGEIAVGIRIKECAEAGMAFDEIVREVTAFIHGMKTYFIVENLDTLIKAGRMGRLTGYVASAMSLRPIMMGDAGEIKLYEKARGSVRAFTRLVDIIGERRSNFSDRTLVITHCNNERQAHFIRAEAARRYNFKEIVVAPTRGISTMYANEGGVIIAF